MCKTVKTRTPKPNVEIGKMRLNLAIPPEQMTANTAVIGWKMAAEGRPKPVRSKVVRSGAEGGVATHLMPISPPRPAILHT